MHCAEEKKRYETSNATFHLEGQNKVRFQLTERYEALRAGALDFTPMHGWGLAVLLQKGMALWIEAQRKNGRPRDTPSPIKTEHTGNTGVPSLSTDHRHEDVVAVVAHMILAVRHIEVEDDRQRTKGELAPSGS